MVNKSRAVAGLAHDLTVRPMAYGARAGIKVTSVSMKAINKAADRNIEQLQKSGTTGFFFALMPFYILYVAYDNGYFMAALLWMLGLGAAVFLFGFVAWLFTAGPLWNFGAPRSRFDENGRYLG